MVLGPAGFQGRLGAEQSGAEGLDLVVGKNDVALLPVGALVDLPDQEGARLPVDVGEADEEAFVGAPVKEAVGGHDPIDPPAFENRLKCATCELTMLPWSSTSKRVFSPSSTVTSYPWNVSPGSGVGSGLGVSGNGVWMGGVGDGDGAKLGKEDGLALGWALLLGEGVGVGLTATPGPLK